MGRGIDCFSEPDLAFNHATRYVGLAAAKALGSDNQRCDRGRHPSARRIHFIASLFHARNRPASPNEPQGLFRACWLAIVLSRDFDCLGD